MVCSTVGLTEDMACYVLRIDIKRRASEVPSCCPGKRQKLAVTAADSKCGVMNGHTENRADIIGALPQTQTQMGLTMILHSLLNLCIYFGCVSLTMQSFARRSTLSLPTELRLVNGDTANRAAPRGVPPHCARRRWARLSLRPKLLKISLAVCVSSDDTCHEALTVSCACRAARPICLSSAQAVLQVCDSEHPKAPVSAQNLHTIGLCLPSDDWNLFCQVMAFTWWPAHWRLLQPGKGPKLSNVWLLWRQFCFLSGMLNL